MTSTLTAPTPVETPLDQARPPGDHDRFQHYFRRDDVTRNLLTGEPMTALCGKVVTQQVDPKGRTVCAECQRLMDEVVGSNLPENERGEAEVPL